MGSTLREALESAVSSQEAKESEIVAAAPEVVDAPVVEAVQPAATEVPIGETDAQRTERLRDEKGRFAEVKADSKGAKGKPVPAEVSPVVAAQVAAPRPPKPDSWKKDYAQDWEKLDPRVAAYIKEREDQYFKGVSTYKQEWEGAKPLLDAVAPFMPDLQRFGVQPAQWIANLGQAHRSLATGSPQEKLATVQNILRNNGIQAQLAVQDQQGNWQLLGQQPMPQQQQASAPQQQDQRAVFQQMLAEERAQQSLAEFERDVQTKYPHYETVKSDMALLLEAGKATDYPSAYGMALRLHDDLFAATQAEKQKADEAARQEAQRKAVAAAKGSVTSTKSATPASSGAATPKGRREALEAAFDQHASGRV